MNVDRNDWIGQTIGEVLDQCHCVPFGLVYIDEPPGKLHGVEILGEVNGDKQKIVVKMNYHADLFSAERHWPFYLIKQQEIVSAYISDKLFF
jgi:hypothetical protein